MSTCNNTWRLKFMTSPDDVKLNFDSKIVPVISSGLDYANATNKPRINGVELVGDKTNEEILICSITNEDLESILK